MVKDVLETILSKYPIENQKNFKAHPFASYIRNDVPYLLNEELKLPKIYTIKASPGNGEWAKIPWIAIFNKTVTETVRNGICLVYLFCADFSVFYLSLMQGYLILNHTMAQLEKII
jgi:5-methylcytosine-specific restriction protein A